MYAHIAVKSVHGMLVMKMNNKQAIEVLKKIEPMDHEAKEAMDRATDALEHQCDMIDTIDGDTRCSECGKLMAEDLGVYIITDDMVKCPCCGRYIRKWVDFNETVK